MARRGGRLAKKSLVVDAEELDRWVRLGGYRNESEAVRGAITEMLAIQDMQRALSRIRRRGTFGKYLDR